MTLTPGPPYNDDAAGRRHAGPPASGTGRRVLPARLVLLGALILVLLIVTGTGSVRTWWAHRLGDVTGGSRPADYVIGLVVGLLPVIGVMLGALGRRGARRLMRMFVLGATGFVLTYLLAPSPARYLSNHATARVFEHDAPGYLPGVVTGIGIWLLAVVVGVLRMRRWWRRNVRHATTRDQDGRGSSHRIIDV